MCLPWEKFDVDIITVKRWSRFSLILFVKDDGVCYEWPADTSDDEVMASIFFRRK